MSFRVCCEYSQGIPQRPKKVLDRAGEPTSIFLKRPVPVRGERPEGREESSRNVAIFLFLYKGIFINGINMNNLSPYSALSDGGKNGSDTTEIVYSRPLRTSKNSISAKELRQEE